MHQFGISLALPLLLAACHVGIGLDEFMPANKPTGIHTSIQSTKARIRGELLGVTDTSLVLRTEREIVSVHYDAFLSVRFAQRRQLNVDFARWPNREAREELRVLSRFPQGISKDVLEQLLAVHQQNRLRTVR